MWENVAQSFGGQRLSSRPSRRRVEGSCIGFWKSKANSTFCKVVKQKGETFWHRKSHLLCNCLVPKPENSAKPNSRTVRRFPVLPTPCAKTAKSCAFCDSLPVFLWHRALVVAQSFVLAAFATLVCQRNCVFLCKGTKLKNSACAEFLGLLCRFLCGTELRFGIEILMSCANAVCQNCKKLGFLR